MGLLTPLGAGMYGIHPALPSYLADQWRADGPDTYAQPAEVEHLAAVYEVPPRTKPMPWSRWPARPGRLNGGTEDCVEVAALPDDRIVVRNSKRPDDAVVFFTRAEMAAWIKGVKNDEFDDLT